MTRGIGCKQSAWVVKIIVWFARVIASDRAHRRPSGPAAGVVALSSDTRAGRAAMACAARGAGGFTGVPMAGIGHILPDGHGDPALYLRAIRRHWSIGNGLH